MNDYTLILIRFMIVISRFAVYLYKYFSEITTTSIIKDVYINSVGHKEEERGESQVSGFGGQCQSEEYARSRVGAKCRVLDEIDQILI